MTDAWGSALRGAGMSACTVRAYVGNVELMAREAGVPPRDLTPAMVSAHLASCRCQATRWQRHKCVRLWAAWLVETGDPRGASMLAGVRAPRRPRGVPRPIPEDQLARVMASPLTVREEAMVVLGAYQGLRISEIARVHGADIDGPRMTVAGKGGRVDVLRMQPRVALAARRMPADDWWFPSARDPSSPISPVYAGAVLRAAMGRAGVDATPHQLRHRFATALVRADVPLPVVARLMRHESVATTMNYVLVDEEQMVSGLMRLAA